MLKSMNAQNINYDFIRDYSIKIKFGELYAGNDFATIPNYNVLGYALAICLRMKASNIELVGFDGFDNMDFRHKEVQHIIDVFEKKYTNINLISITPSKYLIKKKSILHIIK